jgi:hypothetical protein
MSHVAGLLSTYSSPPTRRMFDAANTLGRLEREAACFRPAASTAWCVVSQVLQLGLKARRRRFQFRGDSDNGRALR